MLSNYSYLYKREKEKKRKNEEFRIEIEKKLHDTLPEIVKQFNSIEKVIIFGSFLDERFKMNSDLDLYIEELTGEDFYILKRLLEDNLNIDLDVYTQTDDQAFINKVKERGEVLYERKNRNIDS